MKAIPELVIRPVAVLVDPFGDRAKALKPPVTPHCFATCCNSTFDHSPPWPHKDRSFAGQRRDFQDHIRKIRSRRRH